MISWSSRQAILTIDCSTESRNWSLNDKTYIRATWHHRNCCHTGSDRVLTDLRWWQPMRSSWGPRRRIELPASDCRFSTRIEWERTNYLPRASPFPDNRWTSGSGRIPLKYPITWVRLMMISSHLLARHRHRQIKYSPWWPSAQWMIEYSARSDTRLPRVISRNELMASCISANVTCVVLSWRLCIQNAIVLRELSLRIVDSQFLDEQASKSCNVDCGEMAPSSADAKEIHVLLFRLECSAHR